MKRYQAAIDALCTIISEDVSEDFVIFLCNYEEVNEHKTFKNLINYLLKNLPKQVTLFVESRVVPNISFSSLLVQNEMCGLNTDALRFSAQEIIALANLQGINALTEDEVAQLTTYFDGWIAGILICTYLGERNFFHQGSPLSDIQSLPSYQVDSVAIQKRNELFSYTVNEVFKYDRELQRFLQASSILQQMEPDICNELLDRTDAAERLSRLEYQGLFVTSYKQFSQNIYVCHPVIRELFNKQCYEQDRGRFFQLHYKAAQYWRARQQYEQALYHALESRAYDLAPQIIFEGYKQLLQQGRIETLSRWLDKLPSEMLASHPRFFLIQATIHLIRGQHEMAFTLLNKTSTLIEGFSERTAQCHILQAEVDILYSKALFQTGDYVQAQNFCQRALSVLPVDEIELQSEAEMRLGSCANLQGDFTTGIVHLHRALSLWDNQPPANLAVDIHSALANTYYLMGNFELAQHHLMRTLKYCELLQDEQRKIENLILKGILYKNRGAYKEAEETLLNTLELARSLLYTRRAEAYTLVNLGSLYMEQGNYSQALIYSEDGLTLSYKWGNQSIINSTLADIALIHLFMGDITSALHFAEKIHVKRSPGKSIGYEQVEQELTYCIIFLYQHRYAEAYTRLVAIDHALEETLLKRGRLQTKLCLAACLIALNQHEDVIRHLQEVASLLIDSESYKQLIFVETKWFPTLLQVMKSSPQLVKLRAILELPEEDCQEYQKGSETEYLPQVTEPCPPKIAIMAFDEPIILLSGQPIKHWRMSYARELFFYLLESDRPISKEKIITALWPEYTSQTNQMFHLSIYHIRRLIGKLCLVRHAEGYSLNLKACFGEHVWYDVQEFRAHKREAEQAVVLKDDLRAKEAFLKMVELYRGDYGSLFYNDWCTVKRDELRTAYTDAHRQLAQIAWRHEAFDESAEHWSKMLHIDPCLEEAHYGLMRYYLRQGKRNQALRQYQQCKTILKEELGIQPRLSLQKLYQQLTDPLDSIEHNEH
ncbi:hypothetical protein KTT_54700 [Tengunoibacter tsumagoiensis]|uniref:Bacterial transcriptional activator domain-containing protein n=2 Tax=Tengunoibacter tsumagoiensis TaxID=2014871 RepID=A0A402A9I0_9CHLR|nr:hypothetical protein KTT_54700 [Tengunoibacter tsumagoiensis]